MITISKNLLEQNGYETWNFVKEYEPHHIVRKWQKCVRDETGKKYFIVIDETLGWNWHLNEGEEFHNFWPSVQFNIEVTGFGYQSINIELVQWFNESGRHSKITIEKMEDMIEQIWVDLKGSYYEKY